MISAIVLSCVLLRLSISRLCVFNNSRLCASNNKSISNRISCSEHLMERCDVGKAPFGYFGKARPLLKYIAFPELKAPNKVPLIPPFASYFSKLTQLFC